MKFSFILRKERKFHVGSEPARLILSSIFPFEKRRQGQSQSGDRDSGWGDENWLLHRMKVSD